jgi:hypothetical protein
MLTSTTAFGKEPRDLTVEERRELFRRFKATQVASAKTGTAWDPLDADEPRMLEEIEGLR